MSKSNTVTKNIHRSPFSNHYLLARKMSRSVHKSSKLLELLLKNNIKCQISNSPSNARNIYSTCFLNARVSFNLSDIGEGIREVVVKEWFVKEGDKVSQFDNICEVQSDKASVTITSRFDGIITKLHYKIDEVALVGKPLVDLETDDVVNDEQIVENEETTKEVPNIVDTSPEINEASQENVTQEVLCIPSVRRLAKEHKIDLTKVKASGKNGRILKEDVLLFLNTKPSIRSEISEQILTDVEQAIEPIKGYRKTMVKTMSEALKIPHFVYSDEIKTTQLSKLRKQLKEVKELKDIKITFMPFFIKAASNALQRYPTLNSSLDDKIENIIYHKNHNIGIAMDTEQGLVVPVIKNVESLSIIEIARELNRLIQTGQTGNFKISDLTGGTFTISNIGIIGGTYTKPVILPPQVAIIALGASQLLPRFDECGNVIAEEILNISGSADHRVIDGATMANFTQVLKKQIENPNLLFLNLK